MDLGFDSVFQSLGLSLGGIKLIHIVIAALFFLSCALIIVAVRSSRAMKRTSNEAAYFAAMVREKAEQRGRVLTVVYRVASKIPIVRNYLFSIENCYARICPYDEAYLAKLAADTIAISAGLSVAGVLLILSINLTVEGVISVYSIACSVLAVYFISLETLHTRIGRKEKTVTSDLIHYFANVKHAYLATKNVPQAITDASEGMSYEITLHALQIYGILTGVDRKHHVHEYATSQNTNKNMKLFISQAYEASERGNIVDPETKTSLFTKNLEFHRMEMLRESLRLRNREFKLHGYSLVVCLPVFFMTVLRDWGISFDPAMKSFYSGMGYLVMVLAFAVTVLMYDSINKVKEIDLKRSTKDYGNFNRRVSKGFFKKFAQMIEVQHGPFIEGIRKMLTETNTNISSGAFVVKMTLYTIVATFIGVVFFGGLHYQERRQLITKVDNLDSIVYVATDKQKEVIEKHILEMTEYYIYAEDYSYETVQNDLVSRLYITNQESIRAVSNEVIRRVEAYGTEYFKWYEFVLCVFFGMIVGMLPYVTLRYRYRIVLDGREDEIRQFQAIIIMEYLFPDVTITQILEEMEAFAVVFRKSIRTCINSYSSGPREALLKLREDEKNFPDFAELVDGFLAVEETGISVAFAEVEHNREMAEARKSINEEISLERKTDITDLIASIPAIVVLGGYLLIPFFIYVARSFFEIFDALDALKTF